MIVVLTLGRSGSSLMMQTLKILGADVFGFAFGKNPTKRHVEANPKGYFEDGQLFAKGLNSYAFKKLQELENNNLAFKSDLRNFLKDDIVETWQDAQSKISSVIVSIRIPCEQTRSEFQNFEETARDEDFERNARLEELRMSGEFLQTYQQSFHTLEELLNGPLAVYRDRTFAVDYALARNDPEAYVRRVAQCANLELTERTLAPAMANIEASLYRNKSEDLSETQGQWARQTGAQAAYERINNLIG